MGKGLIRGYTRADPGGFSIAGKTGLECTRIRLVAVRALDSAISGVDIAVYA
jgi:hypothetical protein